MPSNRSERYVPDVQEVEPVVEYAGTHVSAAERSADAVPAVSGAARSPPVTGGLAFRQAA
jgi:hypothetical protein